MWTDNETDLDLLNVTYLVSAVTSTVLNTSLLPITVGIFGDWGSGKSSILRMAQKELECYNDVLCLSFNGWLFEGYEDAKGALMGTILDEIRDKRTLGPKAKELIAKLLKRVDLFELMRMAGKYATTFASGGAAMIAPVELLEDATGVIKESGDEKTEKQENIRKNVREFRTD
ncbi:MAG: P-loop NTPase fold protein, partial [Candidatus Poribacteria bacterium]